MILPKVKADWNETQNKCGTWGIFQIRVCFIGEATKGAKSHFPYATYKEGASGLQVTGLPDGVTMKTPSSYGDPTLRAILAQRHLFKIQGKIFPSAFLNTHSITQIYPTFKW